MWRRIRRLFSRGESDDWNRVRRSRTGSRRRWREQVATKQLTATHRRTRSECASDGRFSSKGRSLREPEPSDGGSRKQGYQQGTKSSEWQERSWHKECSRNERKQNSAESWHSAFGPSQGTSQDGSHPPTARIIPVPVVTRSFWYRAVRDPDDRSRLVLVMRAGERIDRILGNEWIHTQFGRNGEFKPLDGNLPTRVRWHKDAKLDEDSPLTTLGRHSAVLIARALYKRQIRPSLIVSSPALRAVQTANAIAQFLHTTFVVEEGLCEPGHWYTQGGKFPLPRFLTTKEMKSCHFAVNGNYAPVLPSCLSKIEMEKDEAEGYDRIERLLLEIGSQPHNGPLLIVGHAITVHTAALICDAFSNMPNLAVGCAEERSEQRTKQVQRFLPPIELGARYPYACVLAMALNDQNDPPQYEYVPSLIPPLSFGENYSNRIVLTV